MWFVSLAARRRSFLLAARASGAESPRGVRYGGRLVFGIAKDIISLNPFYRTQSTDSFVRELMYRDAASNLDHRQQPIPALAESWSVSKDEKTYTFKLRRGVQFHNGKELTAEDVKWSIDYALDPQNLATGLTLNSNPQEVKAKDKYTLEIALKQPEAAFLVQVSANTAVRSHPQGFYSRRKIQSSPLSLRHRSFRLQGL